MFVTYNKPSSKITENISQRKSATQHGTIGQSYAGLAIDGFRGGFRDGSTTVCAMTNSYDPAIYVMEATPQPAWWTVDLSNNDPTKYFYIQTVTIYNNIGASAGRLTLHSEHLNSFSSSIIM